MFTVCFLSSQVHREILDFFAEDEKEESSRRSRFVNLGLVWGSRRKNRNVVSMEIHCPFSLSNGHTTNFLKKKRELA